MERTVTGRISRRGTFTASSGEVTKANFGKPWQDNVKRRELVRVSVSLGQRQYSAVVPTGAEKVTLLRKY